MSHIKPRIHRSAGQWRCFSHTKYGVRVCGFGATPQAAFKDWQHWRYA